MPTDKWRIAAGPWNRHPFHFAIYSRGGFRPEQLRFPDGRFYKDISFPEARSAQAYGQEIVVLNGGAQRMTEMRFKLSIYRNHTLVGAWFDGKWTGDDPNMV